MPNKEKYKAYIDKIYESGWITNNGECLKELERRLAEYLNVENVICVANGSLALQVAYKSLKLSGDVITTPFSFAATTNTLLWENLNPIFADIDAKTFNIDARLLAKKITKSTSAIVPVHVFGNPCDVDVIDEVAETNGIKVIYDAAHAFDVQYENRSVLNYGNISTLSFHATKLFHTIEGGALITNDNDLAAEIRKLINFGITGPLSIESIGTNAKMNEFEAAMGLCVLDEIEIIKSDRKIIWERYKKILGTKYEIQEWHPRSSNNYAYAPILFESEKKLLSIEQELKNAQVTPRRYFYPSLDTLNYINQAEVCFNSRSIASRIMCLPIYPNLTVDEQTKITDILMENYG